MKKFLNVRLPGPWDEATQARVVHDLEALGYRSSFSVVPAQEGKSELRIELMPRRVVRRVSASGNWPIFEWEVLANMSWRVGSRLPEGADLVAEIRRQERDVTVFLQRKGYYDGTASIFLDWDPEVPEQVNVRVRVHLNVGLFRLRYNIGSIHPVGFHALSEQKLASFFDHCCLWFGRTSTERINEDVKKLNEFYQEKGYVGTHLKADLHFDHKKKRVDLDITVEERRRVKLRFSGNKQVSEKELRKNDVVTIFRDNYAGANEFDESARNIFRLYQQKGFFEARVGWHWIDRSSDPIVVEFTIHEGMQLKVREIYFQPAPDEKPLHFPDSKLSDQITTRRYPRLGIIGLGQGGYASAASLEQDVKRLEEFYRREGYPNPHVSVELARTPQALDSLPLLGLQTATDATSDDAELFVRFRIVEGRREEVGGVEIKFVGPHEQTEGKLHEILGLKVGDAYTPDALKTDIQRLTELFSAVGHPYADIGWDSSTWSPDHTRITLRWVVDERELVKFGPILVRGNFVTRESVIRNALPVNLKEGAIYNSKLIMEAQQNLNARQLFTSTRVTPNPGETDEFVIEAHQRGWKLRRNPVPILIEVIERYDNSGEVGVFVGFSTDNQVFSSASYVWRNVAGLGAELEVRGELGVRIQSLLVRGTLPQLAPFLRIDLRGFWRNENTYSVGLVNSYGANAELSRFFAPTDEQGRRLTPTLRFFTRFEWNFSQILVPLLRPEGSTNIPSNGDRTQSFKLSFGVTWDKRVGFEAPARRLRNLAELPNPLMPVAGHLLSAQVTGAVCCSLSDAAGSFVAFAAQAVLLRPFGPLLRAEDGWPFGMKRFNLTMNLRVNYGIPLGANRPSLPVVERYFAGGDTSTRGYDADTLKAEEVRAPIGALAGDTGYRVVPQGGSVRILSQIEWTFAITSKLLGWPWVGALFVDTGVITDGWEKMRWNDVRFSVGISLLRLLTQFGALSLDYAYPLTLPGQDPLLQSERWKHESWYQHFPGRIHFNWGMPISL